MIYSDKRQKSEAKELNESIHEHKKAETAKAGTDKSSRSAVDADAAKVIGTACTRVVDRGRAAAGEGEAQVCFESCLDVPNAGVLCAVPALLANGILEGAEKLLGKIKGYYTIFQILLVLAFMTLCRIKTVERLRENPPGEFGKLLGLDRIPEARGLLEKRDLATNPYLFRFDMLCEYGVVEIPDTEKVVNPSWREINRSRNQVQSRLRYHHARFSEMTMRPQAETEPEKYQKWLTRKSELLEEIDQHEHQLEMLKAQLKQTPKHITWSELEDKDKFHRLLPGRKRLMDTVRMIAYRAETAMAGLLLGPTVDMSDARRLLQGLFVTDADILPDIENHILRVRIHNASTPADNRLIAGFLAARKTL